MLISDIKKQIFLAAYENLQAPEQWCSGAFAKDSNGYSVAVDDKEAVCWCATGHFYKAALVDASYMRYATELIDEISGYYDVLLYNINDNNSYENTLSYLKRYGVYKGWIVETANVSVSN